MADAFLNILDHRIDKALKKTNFLKSVPCHIVKFDDDNFVEVLLSSTNTRYKVKNLSGTKVRLGQEVQLFYTGEIIATGNPYISCAVPNDGGGGDVDLPVFNYIMGVNSNMYVGLQEGKVISTISFTCAKATTRVINNINFTMLGNTDCQADISILVNSIVVSTDKISVTENSYVGYSLQIPHLCNTGDYAVEVIVKGDVSVTMCTCHTFGFDITETEFFPTTDSDYVFTTNDLKSDIVYYTGEIQNLEIPDTLGECATTKIGATAFNNSDVRAVFIPDGVTEIY